MGSYLLLLKMIIKSVCIYNANISGQCPFTEAALAPGGLAQCCQLFWLWEKKTAMPESVVIVCSASSIHRKSWKLRGDSPYKLFWRSAIYDFSWRSPQIVQPLTWGRGEFHHCGPMELKARSHRSLIASWNFEQYTRRVKSWSSFSVGLPEQFPKTLGTKSMECLVNKRYDVEMNAKADEKPVELMKDRGCMI